MSLNLGFLFFLEPSTTTVFCASSNKINFQVLYYNSNKSGNETKATFYPTFLPEPFAYNDVRKRPLGLLS